MPKFQVLFDVTVAQLSVRTCDTDCDQDEKEIFTNYYTLWSIPNYGGTLKFLS